MITLSPHHSQALLLSLPLGFAAKCLPSDSTCFPSQDEFNALSKSLPTADVIYPGLSRYKAWSDAISLHNQRLDSDHIPHCAVRAQSEEVRRRRGRHQITVLL